MNNFLKTRDEVSLATKYLQDNNLIESGLSCKNWEIAQVIPYLKDGDLVDLGSDGSVVLPNAVALNLKGRKVGIDLAYEEDVVTDWGAELYKGDLMQTSFENESFDIVTSLSVIEHEVDFDKFAKEVSRILKIGGNAYVSFDYWNPKPDYEKRKLYSLDWNILDKNDVVSLIFHCSGYGMGVTSAIDWTVQDAVINDKFCSPVAGVSYSFGLFNFQKFFNKTPE